MLLINARDEMLINKCVVYLFKYIIENINSDEHAEHLSFTCGGFFDAPRTIGLQNLLSVLAVTIESSYPIFQPLRKAAQRSGWRWLHNHSGQIKSAANIRNREFRQSRFCSKRFLPLMHGHYSLAQGAQ